MTEVQDDLSQYRQRRERELSSLYATARSLTALGEVDEVLASIVRHAHELIGTDFTYLSVFDAEGNLSLKSSEGTISSDFKTARVPADTGIGARIVETGSAHWASNYLEDTELHHDEGFDLVVRTEGLKALLGVPRQHEEPVNSLSEITAAAPGKPLRDLVRRYVVGIGDLQVAA